MDSVSRRGALLQAALLGGASEAVLRRGAAATATRIVDAHVHFYDPSRPQGVPWPAPSETILYRTTYPARYLESVQPLAVDGVVVVEASPWLEDNLWLLRLGDDHRLIMGVVGNIPPGHPDFRAAVGRFSRHPLFRGIRVGSGSLPRLLDNAQMFADLKFLAGSDLALDVLLSGQPAFDAIARLSGALPDLRIVLGHLPIASPAGETARSKFQEGLRGLTRCTRVYGKVSGVARRVGGQVPADASFYKPALDELWEIFGPERVIYASNWPVSDLVAPYATIFRLVRDYLAARDQETVDRFFWKNSLAAYKWRERSPKA